MKKLQQQKADALTRFKNYCEANSIVWSTVVAFATALTALGVKLQAILNTAGQQEKNNKGVTKTKKECKHEMATSVVIIAEALQGFANSVGNSTLFDLMQITFTDIYKSKNVIAVSKSELVCNTAADLVSDLGPFGITDEVIETTRQVIEDYKNVESSTGIVVTDKKNYTRNLDIFINEGNAIMRKQLLKVGRQFIATNPDFYYGMVDSAKVINTVVHTKLKLTVMSAGDEPSPLPGCTVTIEGTMRKGTTDAQGYCMISSVPEGRQVIIISKPEYVTLRLEDVLFIRGKSTTITKALTPGFVTTPVTVNMGKVNA